jgi:hypothetical protein
MSAKPSAAPSKRRTVKRARSPSPCASTIVVVQFSDGGASGGGGSGGGGGGAIASASTDFNMEALVVYLRQREGGHASVEELIEEVEVQGIRLTDEVLRTISACAASDRDMPELYEWLHDLDEASQAPKPPKSVKTLKTRKAPALPKTPATSPAPEDCPVCLVAFDAARKTAVWPFQCTHALHYKCAKELFKRAMNDCPVCRAGVAAEDNE